MKSTQKTRQRGPSHHIEFWGCIAAILVITLFGFIPRDYQGTEWDATKAGQYGDFIGGYFGTVFLVVSVAVLVVSYRNQRFANQMTVFESRFFELLQYHRDNAVEIEVDSIKGRRAFVSFVREWRLAIALVKKVEADVVMELSVSDRAVLSYLAFFHGSGPNARQIFECEAIAKGFPPILVAEVIKRMSLDWKSYKNAECTRQDPVLDRAVLSYLAFFHGSGSNARQIEREAIAKGFSPILVAEVISGMSLDLGFYKNAERTRLDTTRAVDGEVAKPLAYTPFEGHHSRLAHYFRHLFHLVKYAADHAPSGTAQEYVELVRAQLTTHEQAILALHAASVSKTWWTEPYLQDFHLIGDIPNGFIRDDEFPVRKVFSRVRYADESR